MDHLSVQCNVVLASIVQIFDV